MSALDIVWRGTSGKPKNGCEQDFQYHNTRINMEHFRDVPDNHLEMGLLLGWGCELVSVNNITVKIYEIIFVNISRYIGCRSFTEGTVWDKLCNFQITTRSHFYSIFIGWCYMCYQHYRKIPICFNLRVPPNWVLQYVHLTHLSSAPVNTFIMHCTKFHVA